MPFLNENCKTKNAIDGGRRAVAQEADVLEFGANLQQQSVKPNEGCSNETVWHTSQWSSVETDVWMALVERMGSSRCQNVDSRS
ncbi:unnamed protein product [Boreogadus saida]